MSQFGDVYSHYYDLLYRDKDYKAESTMLRHWLKSIKETQKPYWT